LLITELLLPIRIIITVICMGLKRCD